MHAARIPSAALVAALLAPAAPTQVVAYHDATGATHQAQFDDLTNQGYRMIALTIYGTTSALRYGAVWVQRPGPAFVAFHGFTSSQYVDFVNTWCPQGYVPGLLTATGSNADARFAGWFEQTNEQPYLRHGLDSDAYFAELQTARDNGWRVRTVDVYGGAGDTRFVVAFEQDGGGQTSATSNGGQWFQEHFDAYVETWARPRRIACNDSAQYLSLWQYDSVGPWIAHHGMTAAEYQQLATDYWQQGLYPISLDGSGSGSGRRFAAVWAAQDRPLARTFTATGQVVPELAVFDDWVRDWMVDNDARGAALAVVKEGRLVLARGYTNAESDYPVTQPTSLFRIASCSKPLTSIAMHQHFEQLPAIGPTTRMADHLPL
jgi:hypothetical protein